MEQWRTIEGYSAYEVSSEGRIRNRKKGNIRKVGRPTDPRHKTRSRWRIPLKGDNGKKTTLSVHRLVALAFIPNPKNLPCINHKDENGLNNRMENLEWCTYKYNNRYGTVRQRNGKKVSIYKEGKLIGIYGSTGIASEILGLNRRIIVQYANQHKIYRGYTFEYV